MIPSPDDQPKVDLRKRSLTTLFRKDDLLKANRIR